MLNLFFILSIIRGVICYLINYSNLLNNLLRLEFISINLYGILRLSCIIRGLDRFFILYFIIIVVCEGVLGLSLLISISYYFSRDYLKSVNCLRC